MPRRVGRPRDHRDNTPSLGIASYPAQVARLDGSAELGFTPVAAQALHHDWNRLRNKSARDDNNPRDWAYACHEAKKGEFDVHLGHLCGMFLLEK